MEDPPAAMPIPSMEPEPISRPSSASTQGSAPHNLLPNLSALAATASASANPPPPRPVAIAPAAYPSGTSPASTHPGSAGGNLPTCQNCATSTTPLWRRDEMGAVLCNACGLFLKLHGRARPISLKTDVIKSRNRVKTMRPDLKHKKNQALNAANDPNGVDFNQNNGVAAANARRASQRSVNGNLDDLNSPVSRTGTPNMYSGGPIYHNIDDQLRAQELANFGVAASSPGRAGSPMNGDMSRTHDQVVQENASLKTRVSELEVIQELYRGRIQQLEGEELLRQAQDPAKSDEQLRAQVTTLTEANAQLQKDLEESHRRENMLKRRLDELEVELRSTKESLDNNNPRPAKKLRLDEEVALAIGNALKEDDKS
ncbi:hypothetical protein QBC47DRAFT_389564 [Echria macrotheca]|uniref:GATA-type domain-containing protein n=1 Tax=Echria macrotheca TaxID=438768 RepID=A0AAJ0B6F3_9PEZI|nr:hypothetical protein QBC47DRAFT_389564 [Echria macrotheca]